MSQRDETTRARRPPQAASDKILEPHETERLAASGAVVSVQGAEIVPDRSYLEQL
jgi:hypothetical protein